ncbi:MAG TPA: NADH-quinone oxidoreductase subunit NuoE, partial [Aurantimonas coralicida]|nr:NADH-quinone oxidoreductase subunit NuoE [Aurantimonas coralicida]
MSVRRLAEDAIQPKSFAFTDENTAWAQATIRKYPEGRQQSAVIPLLMRAQEQEGWVTKSAIVHIADMLAMPLIRVLEVATFYTQFQLKPVGTRAHVQVCGTTPCMLRGAEGLKAVCRSKIHAEPFHANEAGTLSWEEVECLGACVNAPMVMVSEDTYEDLTPERLEEIIDLFEAGRGGEVEPGPQNGRHLSAPIGGLTSLTGDYDDLIKDLPADKPRASEASAPARGKAGGQAIPTAASNAGRPNTDAAETDPTIAAPGKASGDTTPPSAEKHV